jgi:hypothetical protein
MKAAEMMGRFLSEIKEMVQGVHLMPLGMGGPDCDDNRTTCLFTSRAQLIGQAFSNPARGVAVLTLSAGLDLPRIESPQPPVPR